MAKLITPAQLQEVEDALRDVLDTFADTPITLKVTNDLSLDPFNENRNLEYTEYNFMAQVQYLNDKSKADANFAGYFNTAGVKIFIEMGQAEAAGFISNDYPIASPDSTLLEIDNDGTREKYRVRHISTEGAITKRQTYVLIVAERQEIKAS